MSPRPSLAAERKPQILRATVRVIGERGIEATRLADVAAEAGVSVGAIQHYFGTRERLLTEAFAFESERAAERWRVAGDGEADAWARLTGLIDGVLDPDRARARWARWLEFWAASARDPALRPAMRQAYEYWRGPILRAIEAGIAEGLFRPSGPLDAVVDRVVASFDGLALQVLLDGMPLERMRGLLRSGLAAELGVEGTAAYRVPKAQKRPSSDRAATSASRPRAASSGT